MKPKHGKETPIERIFREVVGRKMNPAEKRILLRAPPKPRVHTKHRFFG